MKPKWTTEVHHGAKVHRIAQWVGTPEPTTTPALHDYNSIIARAFRHMRDHGVHQFPGVAYLDFLYENTDDKTREIILETIVVAYCQAICDAQQFMEQGL